MNDSEVNQNEPNIDFWPGTDEEDKEKEKEFYGEKEDIKCGNNTLVSTEGNSIKNVGDENGSKETKIEQSAEEKKEETKKEEDQNNKNDAKIIKLTKEIKPNKKEEKLTENEQNVKKFVPKKN